MLCVVLNVLNGILATFWVVGDSYETAFIVTHKLLYEPLTV
jgi:hypothetical protein